MVNGEWWIERLCVLPNVNLGRGKPNMWRWADYLFRRIEKHNIKAAKVIQNREK
jgi:hypothetical protein